MKKLTTTAANLPTVQELYSLAQISELKKQQDLLTILNMEPQPEWIKVHPHIKQIAIIQGREVEIPYLYVPIGIQEWLLTAIYSRWRLRVNSYSLLANSVAVHATLMVRNPITGEWDEQDGLGAAPLQTNKGASATDWTQIKSAAVQMGLPAAEVYAQKDAAEKFGKIFGKDLNRRDTMTYGNLGSKTDESLRAQVSKALEGITDPDKRNHLLDIVITAEDAGLADAAFYVSILEQI